MERNYTAFILKDDDGYTVLFPDLPGCMTVADTFDEAYNAARDVLPGYLEALRQENSDIPDPRPFETVDVGEDDRAAVVGKIVISTRMPGTMVRTNITIESYLLSWIDRVTTNRSAFFSELAEREMKRRISAA